MRSFPRTLALPFAFAAGGFCNGFFGSGGGIPLVFSLEKTAHSQSKYRITLSFCVVFSIFSVLFETGKDLFHPSFLPLLLAAIFGGWLGSHLLFSLKSAFVNRLFCALLIFSGGMMIWRSVR